MSIRIERDADPEGRVWVVTIARPDVRNAVDRATADTLADAFRQFEADETARVAVLAGEGGTFCAGADLKAIAQGDANRTEPEGDGPMGPTRMLLAKPVIAAIEGHAVGGGLELALWCDLRVMAQDATLGFYNRKWGVPLVDGGTVRLPRLIGLSRALDLILTGRPVRAGEALGCGLVNRVCAAGDARGTAIALAREIAAFPPHALHGDRMSAHEQHGLALDAALRNEFAHGAAALQHETTAGAQAFTQRER